MDKKLQTVEEYNRNHNNELPELIGEKVILMPIPDSNEFYSLYLEWISNEDMKKKIGEEKSEYAWKDVKEMHDEWRKDFRNMTFCIIDKTTKEPVGDVNIFDSDEFNGLPEISIMIGGQHPGKGYGKEASRLLLDFAFTKLKLGEIHLSVYKDNLPAVILYEKLGFKTYAEVNDEDNGREEYLMKITKQIYRKINASSL